MTFESTLFPMHAVVLAQRERTRNTSTADIKRFIEESESKITSLESRISALVELRDRERACVAALKHLISPIHTVPVELLVEILRLAIRDYDYVKDVLRISQVSSYWRQVTHSTPRLWSRRIRIDLCKGFVEAGTSGSDANWSPVDFLEMWLLRCSPLTVPVSMTVKPWSWKRSQRVLDGIFSTAPRWDSLSLDWPSLSFVSQLAEAKLENLENLDLGSLHSHQDDPATFPSFTTIPRLRKLCIAIYAEAGLEALPISLPWAQLTELTLVSRFPSNTLDILAQCTNLIKADLRTAGWAEPPEPRQVIPFSHLRALSLHFFEEKHFVPFLDRLAAPALEELGLDLGDMRGAEAESWSPYSFTAFQLRAPDITQLELKYSHLTSNDLKIAICHAPSLTHLKLTACYHCIDDTLIDALSYKAGVRPLAPYLHHLLLDRVGENFVQSNLASMIVSRWWTDAEAASRLVSPTVARWTCVQLGDFLKFSDDFEEILKFVPRDVLMVV